MDDRIPEELSQAEMNRLRWTFFSNPDLGGPYFEYVDVAITKDPEP